MGHIQFIHNGVKSNFYNHLTTSLNGCKKFDFSVAFISDAAIQLMTDLFMDAEKKGIKGRILTTDYMFGTDPKALRRLMKFHNIEVRIYQTMDRKSRGFHPKGYLFEYEDSIQVTVGSANLTSSALKTNHEWNIAYYALAQPKTYLHIKAEFDYLWDDENVRVLDSDFIDQYEVAYNKQKYSKISQEQIFAELAKFLSDHVESDLVNRIADIYDLDPMDINEIIDNNLSKMTIKPNLMQERALESLKNLRELGCDKGLIIAATGTGKTYLAAFDALQVQPKRLLFIVHREKILKDAERTFKNLLDVKTGLFTGHYKEIDADYVFASIQTISKHDNLYRLDPHSFDYIAIDEAHRSAASTYLKVINHFKPKFLLGLTATPERTDANSIFELFDNQVVAEIRLRDALEDKLVVPFHYFGIRDIATDYSGIDITKDIDVLAELLNVKARVDLIVENIEKYGHSGNKTKALGFCAGVKHANYMAEEFNKRGLTAVALTKDDSESDREMYIAQLEDNHHPLKYIFAVDILNEGIDIPSLNLILMLRPTKSPIIFTQQLGRGLRLHSQKEYLTVLDFIGNHNRAFMIPIALTGDRTYDSDDIMLETSRDFMGIPGDTFIRLDPISREDILKQLQVYDFNKLKNLSEIYQDTKRQLKGEIPTLMDFGFDGFDPTRFIEKSKSYIEFIHTVEKTDNLEMLVKDNELIKYMRFIDSMLPLKRIHEFVIIDLILHHKTIQHDLIRVELQKYIIKIDDEDIIHAINHLIGDLLTSVDQTRYNTPLSLVNNTLTVKPDLERYLQNLQIHDLISNSIQYGIERYKHEFGRFETTYPQFKLHYQYELRDVTQIARYDSIHVIQSGVSLHQKHFYLFITLDKGNVRDEINFKDKFINPKIMEWESMRKTSQDSPIGQNLIHHEAKGIEIHLFVKKGGKNTKYYSTKMLYLGKAKVISYKDNNPIKFRLLLEHEVPEDIYFRLTTEYKNEEKN